MVLPSPLVTMLVRKLPPECTVFPLPTVTELLRMLPVSWTVLSLPTTRAPSQNGLAVVAWLLEPKTEATEKPLADAVLLGPMAIAAENSPALAAGPRRESGGGDAGRVGRRGRAKHRCRCGKRSRRHRGDRDSTHQRTTFGCWLGGTMAAASDRRVGGHEEPFGCVTNVVWKLNQVRMDIKTR